MPTSKNSSSTLSSPGVSIGTTPASINGTPASSHQDYAVAANSSPADPMPQEGEYQIVVPPAQSFQCLQCPKCCNTKSLLNRHIKKHTLPHICTFQGCMFRAAERRDLNRHQSTNHRRIRCYFCPVAGCRFHADGPEGGFSMRLDNAKRHLKSHDNHQDMSVFKEE